MVHPMVERLPDGAEPGHVSCLPVYPVTEVMRDAGVNNRLISKAVRWIFDAKPRYPAVVPEEIERKRKFPSLETCLREIHLPTDLSQLDKFKERLKYEELYRLALTLRWSRRAFALPGRSLHPGNLPERFRKTLPFDLTADQDAAITVLYEDATSTRRMHRLLQGDVGSGKTLVAFFAGFPALAGGFQVAWLAPTEVLADQTWQLIDLWLAPLGFRAALLKAGIAPDEKKSIVKGLATGTVRFVVGTHALLEPSVKFKTLGMIVIDEQHRFGAAQRLVMQEKDPASDFLLMSATPIPQTLAKTLYGDLDIVTILHPPAGRLPVETRVVPESKRLDMEKFVRAEINEKGSAVYFVVPRIEHQEGADDDADLKDAETVFAGLKKGALAGFPAACLHGRMTGDEKSRVMKSFVNGAVKILVSTTVIEVGVDVARASIIIIENAERFGLAQLHQLRGRVGRSGEKSWCFLLTPSQDEQTRERLAAFCRHHDGFKIADMDLSLRGPGEVSGFRQTGWEDLRLADILRDAPLFREIQDEIDARLPARA
jgi:ATP-dependent DNA helicase RecG